MPESTHIRVKLIKSTIGCSEKQKACVRGLGLRRLNSTSTLPNTPEVKGMINRVSFLVSVL